MDSKRIKWSSLAEFLQSEKLSEYIPTFSTLNIEAFSQLTRDDIEKQVSPIYDRARVLDAVNTARACLYDAASEDTPHENDDILKTPTKSGRTYLKAVSKVPLRPTKSLSPPMKVKHSRGRPIRSLDSDIEEKSEIPDVSRFMRPPAKSEPIDFGAIGDGETNNLVRLRRNLGSSDSSIPTVTEKCGDGTEPSSGHRGRSNVRRATEFRLSTGDFSPNISPCPSPRALSPSRPPALPSLVNLTNYTRRWSVASSDYFSGSPSSLSSASSQERLCQLQHAAYRISDEDAHLPLQRQHSQPDAKSRGRPRARSLSPERPIDGSLAAATSYNIYKERFPQAKEEMERKLEAFIASTHLRSQGEVKGEANANFIHHRVAELAKDILNKSNEGRITDTYFEEVSTTLVKLMNDSEKKVSNAASIPGGNSHIVAKEASELLNIIARSARLLECLTFSVQGSFYTQVTDGTIDELLKSTSSLPRYISSRLSTKFGDIEREEPVSPGGTFIIPPPPGSGTATHQTHPSSSGTEDEDRMPQFKEEDFDVRKLISNGAYGEVYLVRHKESRELFAMKRIRKDRVIERSEIERAFMERDILSFVQNPFVVSMLCSFQTKTHLCMVLEYVEGGDVGTLLSNIGVLDADLARMYHAETVLALEYIHSYGIVHRDLKPENLLITKEGHIKLTDFGLSKCGLMQMATRTYENSVAAFDKEMGCTGTPDYIAPEVIYSRQYGFSVDWWSMGIILYQFLVGVTPFHGETIQMLFESISISSIEWPDDDPVDIEAQDLILRLLLIDPSQRLGSQGAQEVKAHPFYTEVHWDELMMHKAEFIPYLDSDEDTSYFDTRKDRYDHSISDDCVPSLEDSHIKYFDSVNWSNDQFIALHSPRNRHCSHDSIDSGTDNQPSISTDDGHSSSGEQPQVFHTSAVRDRCHSDSVLKSVKEEGGGGSPPLSPNLRQTKTPDRLIVSSTPTSTAHQRHSPQNTPELIRNLCTPVKVKQIATNVSDNSSPSVEVKSDTDNTPNITTEDTSRDMLSTTDQDSSSSNTPYKSPVKRLDLSPLKGFRHLAEEEELGEEGRGGERIITIEKGVGGYGFVLNATRVATKLSDGSMKYSVKHKVSNVNPKGAAAIAGLKKDDLIIGVNGENAVPLTHYQLVEKIKQSGNQVELRVIPIALTSIQARKSYGKKGKKKKRQSSFFKKATHARGDSLSMEKFLHLSRSKTREKQNSDSDKSGNEQDSSLVVHGHQVFQPVEQPDPAEIPKQKKLFRQKFNRRRPSSNFVTPVSPLARTPSPTGHCYFPNDPERKTPRSSSQKTLHVTHPRTSSLSKKDSGEKLIVSPSSSAATPKPSSSSPVSKKKIMAPSPSAIRRRSTITNTLDSAMLPPAPAEPENSNFLSLSQSPNSPTTTTTTTASSQPPLTPIRGDHLLPANRSRRKSWVQGVEEKESL